MCRLFQRFQSEGAVGTGERLVADGHALGSARAFDRDLGARQSLSGSALDDESSQLSTLAKLEIKLRRSGSRLGDGHPLAGGGSVSRRDAAHDGGAGPEAFHLIA